MSQAKKNPDPSMVPLKDPRHGIWGRIWKVRIPRIATYSTAYLQSVGIPSSGFADVDVGQMTALAHAYITINQMVEYYHSNVEVRIVKKEDVRSIFEICQDYTFTAAMKIRNGAFAHEFPLEDLIKIDEFAEAVYQYAGHEYGKDKDFIRTFVPEGVMQQAIQIQSLFDSVDQRIKDRKKKKKDQYTVYTTFSGEDKRGLEPMKYAGDVVELPPRASARDLFEHMLGRGQPGERY